MASSGGMEGSEWEGSTQADAMGRRSSSQNCSSQSQPHLERRFEVLARRPPLHWEAALRGGLLRRQHARRGRERADGHAIPGRHDLRRRDGRSGRESGGERRSREERSGRMRRATRKRHTAEPESKPPCALTLSSRCGRGRCARAAKSFSLQAASSAAVSSSLFPAVLAVSASDCSSFFVGRQREEGGHVGRPAASLCEGRSAADERPLLSSALLCPPLLRLACRAMSTLSPPNSWCGSLRGDRSQLPPGFT